MGRSPASDSNNECDRSLIPLCIGNLILAELQESDRIRWASVGDRFYLS